MASQDHLHFIFFPFMAQGHMLPMIDCARLLAQHGIIITIVTTPLNAARNKTILARAVDSGLQIRLIQVQFPSEAAGLPAGCESLDMLPSLDLASNFFTATGLLQVPVEKLCGELTPRPSCIVSDTLLPWTIHIANKLNVPRFSFHGIPCFSLLCSRNYYVYKVFEKIKSESEKFVMPGLPDDDVEFTKLQLPGFMHQNLEDFGKQVVAAEMETYGLIVNTVEELESAYVREYKKTRNGKVWCVGPVSLCNKDSLDMVQRGNKSSIDGNECLKWLDSQETSSVVYVCLGSLCNLIPAQLIELGLGLEASNRPFIWVVRGRERSEELEKWISEYGFEQRTKGRGLLIRGWAPQVLILSHPGIGGFLTHCGWNSTLEGISAGVPMITWPLFADQFFNEKLVVQILKIGVRSGVEVPQKWGKEESVGVLIKKEDVMMTIDKLMNQSEESQQRRTRAKELGKLANKAMEEGGSSQLNMNLLIQDIMQKASHSN